MEDSRIPTNTTTHNGIITEEDNFTDTQNTVIEMILDGKSFKSIAKHLGISIYQLNTVIRKEPFSHIVRQSLTLSANTFADMAVSILETAPSDKVELMRANYLSQVYRWMASKRAPLVYGERVDVTSEGKAVVVLNLGAGVDPSGGGAGSSTIDITHTEEG